MSFMTEADFLTVMTAKALSDLTGGDATKRDAAADAGRNDIMSIVRRKVVPTTIPVSGGSRSAFLAAARYRLYATNPDTLVVPSAGFSNPKHPVVYDYERALADARAVQALKDGADWPELTNVAADAGTQRGIIFDSEKPHFDPPDTSSFGPEWEWQS